MRNVVVTGGSRGLGLAMSVRLAGAGYRVIAVARHPSAELAAAAEAAAAGAGAIVFHAADLSRIEDIPRLARDLRAHGPIHGLINNAGSGANGMLGLMADPGIEALVRLNTVAPIVLTKHLARSMMTARSGRIINISSVAASCGSSGLSVYAATKASLLGFTRALARELGPLGITVNAIAPGVIETDMTRSLDAADRQTLRRRSALGVLAQPEDVARSAEFLLGDGGRHITGTVITVDAGSTA